MTPIEQQLATYKAFVEDAFRSGFLYRDATKMTLDKALTKYKRELEEWANRKG